MKLKKGLKNIRLKINKIGARKRNSKLLTKDFSIISNNCYAGIVDQYLDLQYNTPTIGLYFFAKEYIRFLSNLKYYLNCPLKFIETKKSKYFKELCKRNQENAIIGILDDVEIVFLHYSSEQEAEEKWMRRKQRLSKNLIIKFNDTNLCTKKDIEDFNKLPYKHKICFAAKKYPDIKCAIWMKKYRFNKEIKEDYYSGHKYFNIINYINNFIGEIYEK